MSRRIAVGIDIGTYQIKVVVAELYKEKNKHIPRVIGRGIAESKGLRHGYIVNQMDVIKSLEKAVGQAERSAGVKIRKAFISVGGVSLEGDISEGSVIPTRGDFEVTDLDVDKVLRASENNTQLTNKKVIHRIPIQFELDDKKVLGKPVGLKGKKLKVKTLFVTYLKQHLDDLIQAIESVGIDVEDVVASPIAAGIVTLTKSQKIAGCVLVNIGSETVSMVVYENNTPVSLEVLPVGSMNITNDIALGLKIPLDEAEKVKLGVVSGVSYSKKKLDEIISARLADIFDLVDAHLVKIKRSGLLPAGIVLTGGGSGITTIEDLAKATLNLPSKIASVNFVEGGSASGKIKDSTWAVAYGLCVLGLNATSETTFAKNLKNIRSAFFNWLKQFSV